MKGILLNYKRLEETIKAGISTITQMPSEFIDRKSKAQAELAKRELAKKTYDLSTMTSEQKAEKRDELAKKIKDEISAYKKGASKYSQDQLQVLSNQIEEYIEVANSIEEDDDKYEDPDLAIMQFRVILIQLLPRKA